MGVAIGLHFSGVVNATMLLTRATIEGNRFFFPGPFLNLGAQDISRKN